MNSKIDIRVICLGFFVLAIALRLIPHSYNLAAIGAMGMFVGCFWSARMGFLMALAAMGVSDVLGHWLEIPSMGFYSPALMLTVYVAIGAAALVGKGIGFIKSDSSLKYWIGVPAGAVASALVFFLITNFASWLDPQMPYTKDLSGLVQCYVAAIPFAKNTLVGNLLFSSLFFGGFALMTSANTQEVSATSRMR